MNDQRELFSTARLATRCPVCGCTRPPDQDRATECGVDLSRAAGDYLTRPAECLNVPDPANNPIPY